MAVNILYESCLVTTSVHGRYVCVYVAELGRHVVSMRLYTPEGMLLLSSDTAWTLDVVTSISPNQSEPFKLFLDWNTRVVQVPATQELPAPICSVCDFEFGSKAGNVVMSLRGLCPPDAKNMQDPPCRSAFEATQGRWFTVVGVGQCQWQLQFTALTDSPVTVAPAFRRLLHCFVLYCY
jgi:hypothetical protein